MPRVSRRSLLKAGVAGTVLSGTTFCQSIGDAYTRLDRYEPNVNSAIPGDLRDTKTPEAIGRSFGRLLLAQALVPR